MRRIDEYSALPLALVKVLVRAGLGEFVTLLPMPCAASWALRDLVGEALGASLRFTRFRGLPNCVRGTDLITGAQQPGPVPVGGEVRLA